MQTDIPTIFWSQWILTDGYGQQIIENPLFQRVSVLSWIILDDEMEAASESED